MAVAETDKTKKRLFTDGSSTLLVTINYENTSVSFANGDGSALSATDLSEANWVALAACFAQAATWVNTEFNPA